MKSDKPKGKPKPREYELVGADELAGRISSLPGEARLAAITGMDTGEKIEVLYHLELPDKILTLRVPLNREIPSVETVTKILPAALLYEREIAEMLGVEIRSHPRQVNTFIADDYRGPPPLRKAPKA
jgi:NADH:ubiquinone oxidoreductase subunit C